MDTLFPQPTAAEVPDTLWHFTSLGGLNGILSSGHLRAYDAATMEDGQELRYGERLVLDVVRELADAASIPGARAALGAFRHAFRQLPLSAQESHAGADTRRRESLVFIASTTENPGPEHWISYAGHDGLALELDLRPLLEHGERLVAEHRGGTAGVGLFPLVYDEQQQRDLVQRTFEQAIRANGAATPEALCILAAQCVVRFKAPKFAAEREWRVALFRRDATEPLYDPTRNRTFLELPSTTDDGVQVGRIVVAREEDLAKVDGMVTAHWPAGPAPRPRVLWREMTSEFRGTLIHAAR